MRVSIRQVAERAGVSAMTVSNVLRDREDQMVGETRARVLQAIHDLGYVPVRSAIQNRHVATKSIGLVFIHALEGEVGSPTFLGMCDRARQKDYDLTVLLRSEPDWVKPGTESQFLDRRCDGFIFIGDSRREITEALVRHNIPVVECYSVFSPPGVANILLDNVSAMRQAVTLLAGHGHTRIAHLAGPRSNGEALQRLEGYRSKMWELFGEDPDKFVVQGETWGDLWGYNQGDPGWDTRPFAEAVLALNVTAVVCVNDLYALAVWRLAEEKGLRVPEDISIVGMDNIAQGAERGLTSVAPCFKQVGRAAVDAILTLLQGGSSADASQVIPVSLLNRASVAAPHTREI